MLPEIVVDQRAVPLALKRDWLGAGPPRALNICKLVHAHVAMPFATDLARDAASLDVVEVIPGRDTRARNRRRS